MVSEGLGSVQAGLIANSCRVSLLKGSNFLALDEALACGNSVDPDTCFSLANAFSLPHNEHDGAGGRTCFQTAA